MQSAIDLSKVKNKEYKIPLVVPIVLYTGNKTWDAKKYLEKNQEKLENIEVKLGNYNLLDINNFTEEQLLKENTLISKLMLIEKSTSAEDTINLLEKIIKKVKKEDMDTLKRIISIVLSEKIGIIKANELINKMEGDDDNMLAVVDMIRRENQMYIEIGKKEGRKEGKREGKLEGRLEGKLEEKIKIATNMLKEKFNIETIHKITGINKEELEKIAKIKNVDSGK